MCENDELFRIIRIKTRQSSLMIPIFRHRKKHIVAGSVRYLG